jgi:acyl carrier protein
MKERVKKLIAAKFLGGDEAFGDSDKLRDLGLTSLQFVELLILLENEFGFEIPDEDIIPGRFSSVQNIAEYVESKLG